jgi:hypothetical protein
MTSEELPIALSHHAFLELAPRKLEQLGKVQGCGQFAGHRPANLRAFGFRRRCLRIWEESWQFRRRRIRNWDSEFRRQCLRNQFRALRANERKRTAPFEDTDSKPRQNAPGVFLWQRGGQSPTRCQVEKFGSIIEI